MNNALSDRARQGRSMQEANEGDIAADVVEAIAGIEPGSELQALRQRREKVAAATQGSYLALFHPSVPGLALQDRLLVALHASLLSASPALAAHYRERLLALQADARLVGAVERLAFQEVVPAGSSGTEQADQDHGDRRQADQPQADRAAQAGGRRKRARRPERPAQPPQPVKRMRPSRPSTGPPARNSTACTRSWPSLAC